MHGRNRIFAAGLAAVMMASAASAAGVSDWAEAEVSEAVGLGFVSEHLRDSYTQPITRGEFAEVAVAFLAMQLRLSVNDTLSLYRDHLLEEGSKRADYLNVFSDTEQAVWAPYAYLFGIADGRGDGTFDPDGAITREEAAKMLYNTYCVYAADEPSAEGDVVSPGYADSGEISGWAETSVAVLAEWDVMRGISETEFDPDGLYTREQCYVTFLRLYKNAPESRLHGNVENPVTFEEMTAAIEQSYSYVPLYSAETEECRVLYGVHTAASPRISGYTLWIVYRDGGRVNVIGGFGTARADNLLEEFEWNEDRTELFCTQKETGKRYRIDIGTGTVRCVER